MVNTGISLRIFIKEGHNKIKIKMTLINRRYEIEMTNISFYLDHFLEGRCGGLESALNIHLPHTNARNHITLQYSTVQRYSRNQTQICPQYVSNENNSTSSQRIDTIFTKQNPTLTASNGSSSSPARQAAIAECTLRRICRK